MLTTDTRERGRLVAVVGSTGTGKTRTTMDLARKAQRVLAWDPRGDWRQLEGRQVVESVRELGNTLARAGDQGAVVVYNSGRVEDFHDVCRAAYLWAKLWPCLVILDEAADAVDPGKAREWYGQLQRKGGYYGLHLHVIVQRPQESDTSLWGNADATRVHLLRRPKDQEYMAKQLGHPELAERIGKLKADTQAGRFEFLEVTQGGDVSLREYDRGTIRTLPL